MAGKSVLVVDTPKTCKECRCQMMLVCVPADEDIDEYVDPNTTIPEWCPLRPLPEKLYVEVNQIEDVMPSEFDMDKLILKIRLDADKLCALGWNTCLDEIMGENE